VLATFQNKQHALKTTGVANFVSCRWKKGKIIARGFTKDFSLKA
jgi:hypothetical protein